MFPCHSSTLKPCRSLMPPSSSHSRDFLLLPSSLSSTSSPASPNQRRGARSLLRSPPSPLFRSKLPSLSLLVAFGIHLVRGLPTPSFLTPCQRPSPTLLASCRFTLLSNPSRVLLKWARLCLQSMMKKILCTLQGIFGQIILFLEAFG